MERKRSGAILVLFLASAVFWAAYEQAGSSLNLFAERSTNHVMLRIRFSGQLVPICSVAFRDDSGAGVCVAMDRAGANGSRPAQPSSRWACCSEASHLRFWFRRPGRPSAGALVSPWWLTGTYFLQTVGEMCLSPVGLSAMTKLAPARVAGMMMGLFFVSISIGDYLAGMAASLYESMPLPELCLAWWRAFHSAAAAILALLVKPTVKLMSGVK